MRRGDALKAFGELCNMVLRDPRMMDMIKQAINASFDEYDARLQEADAFCKYASMPYTSEGDRRILLGCAKILREVEA